MKGSADLFLTAGGTIQNLLVKVSGRIGLIRDVGKVVNSPKEVVIQKTGGLAGNIVGGLAGAAFGGAIAIGSVGVGTGLAIVAVAAIVGSVIGECSGEWIGAKGDAQVRNIQGFGSYIGRSAMENQRELPYILMKELRPHQ